MNKEQAIRKLEILKDRGKILGDLHRSSQDFEKWHRDTEVAIERIFGEQNRHLKDFRAINYSLSVVTSSTLASDFDRAYRNGVWSALTVIDSFIDEINDYWVDDKLTSNINVESDPISKVELIIRRFHQVARQFRQRYSDRPSIEIDDEYDVQYLFHALLKLYFDDVRPEEFTPSYAGSASRVDFLLKSEQIIIEIKKTRQGLGAKQIGEQLIIDSQKYQVHPDCRKLICFVYDPEGRVANPRGIENDLTKDIDGLSILVFITPI